MGINTSLSANQVKPGVTIMTMFTVYHHITH